MTKHETPVPAVNLLDAEVEPNDDAWTALARAMLDLVHEPPATCMGNPAPAAVRESTRRRPVLVVFAGPNGSGKTTMAQVMLQQGWLDGFEYINPDNIARNRFGDWNDPAAVVRAARYAAEVRKACLGGRRAMAIETVFSSPRSFGFVRKAYDAGYVVRLLFLGTDNPSINVRRVARRVLQGGHDVPTPRILARHPRSIANLASALPWADRVRAFDNSVDEAPPVPQFQARDGVVTEICADGHAWAEGARTPTTATRGNSGNTP